MKISTDKKLEASGDILTSNSFPGLNVFINFKRCQIAYGLYDHPVRIYTYSYITYYITYIHRASHNECNTRTSARQTSRTMPKKTVLRLVFDKNHDPALRFVTFNDHFYSIRVKTDFVSRYLTFSPSFRRETWSAAKSNYV